MNMTRIIRRVVGLKVLDRKVGRGQRSPVFLAVEAGERHPVTVQLSVDQYQHRTGTNRRTVQENHVCHRIVLHDDLHDLRGLWQRRRRDRQREDFYHLHDDHCRYDFSIFSFYFLIEVCDTTFTKIRLSF